jgi:hypothetical protein
MLVGEKKTWITADYLPSVTWKKTIQNIHLRWYLLGNGAHDVVRLCENARLLNVVHQPVVALP